MAKACNIQVMQKKLNTLLKDTIKSMGKTGTTAKNDAIDVITKLSNNNSIVNAWASAAKQSTSPEATLMSMKNEATKQILTPIDTSRVVNDMKPWDASNVGNAWGQRVSTKQAASMKGYTEVLNFGNPFLTGDFANTPLEYKTADKDSGLATTHYYDWLMNDVTPDNYAGGVKQLKERRDWILDNLATINNANAIHYKGTADGSQINHVTALIAIAEEKLGKNPNPTKENVPKKAKATIKNAYEVSTKGDKRYSALVAKLPDGRTIEEAYQLDVKGYREEAEASDLPAYQLWKAGKNSPPKDTSLNLQREYAKLWMQYFTANPAAYSEISDIVNSGKTLTDQFSQEGNVNQATTIQKLVEAGWKPKTLNTSTTSTTPEFDKLPSYVEGQKTMTYAGVGSRGTPVEIQQRMNDVAKYLEGKGYTLRSGNALGADKAFEGAPQPWEKDGEKVTKWSKYKNKITKKEIYKSQDATPQTIAIANEIHESNRPLTSPGKELHARNTMQIFGANLDTPVDFVLAWTPLNDKGEVVTRADQRFYGGKDNPNNTGGTGQAIAYASLKGIPVINMADPKWEKQLMAVLNSEPKVTKATTTVADLEAELDTDSIAASIARTRDESSTYNYRVTGTTTLNENIRSKMKKEDDVVNKTALHPKLHSINEIQAHLNNHVYEEALYCDGGACREVSGKIAQLLNDKNIVASVVSTTAMQKLANGDTMKGSHKITVFMFNDKLYQADIQQNKYMTYTVGGGITIDKGVDVATLKPEIQPLHSSVKVKSAKNIPESRYIKYFWDTTLSEPKAAPIKETAVPKAAKDAPNELNKGPEPVVEEAPIKETVKDTTTKYELFPGVHANQDQANAIEDIKTWFTKENTGTYLLKGRGGTGKTTVVNKVLQELNVKADEAMFATPSNKAKVVIKTSNRDSEYATSEYSTTHSLLNYTEETVNGITTFVPNPNPFMTPQRKLEGIKVLVIDEVSMLNSSLKEELEKVATDVGTKILYMGDNVQLAPVKDFVNGKQVKESVVFSEHTDVTSNLSELKERMRQGEDSPILSVTDSLAESVEAGKAPELDLAKAKDNSPLEVSTKSMQGDVKDFINAYKADPAGTRWIWYNKAANANTVALVKTIRDALFGDKAVDPLVNGEQVYISKRLEVSGGELYNGMEAKVEDINFNGVLDTTYGNNKMGRFNVTLPVTSVTLTDNITGDVYRNVPIANGSTKAAIEQLRQSVPPSHKKALNSLFFKALPAYAIEFGGVINTHKAQGSTYNTVYTDVGNIMAMPIDDDSKGKSLYVATSRPKQKLVLMNVPDRVVKGAKTKAGVVPNNPADILNAVMSYEDVNDDSMGIDNPFGREETFIPDDYDTISNNNKPMADTTAKADPNC